jgi:hypothetical protein
MIDYSYMKNKLSKFETLLANLEKASANHSKACESFLKASEAYSSKREEMLKIYEPSDLSHACE